MNGPPEVADAPRPTRGERRRARTRRAILDAAEAAFSERGYRETRMEDVAEAADVAVGSIYGHFGNKDGLYLALVDRALDLFAAYLEAAYATSDSPLEQVVACGDAYLRFHLEHPGSFRFLAFDGVETRMPIVDADLHEDVNRRVSAVLDKFRATIERGRDSGEIAPHVDSYLMARFLWGGWNGVVALGLRTDTLRLSEEEIERTLQLGRRMVRDGLCAVGHRDASGESLARMLTIESPPDADAA